MSFLLYILIVAAALLPAQRHLPQTQVFRSPGLILMDTQVESPAVYDGSGPAHPVRRGESFDIQIFAPRAAGQSIYEYSFAVQRLTDRRIPLTITSARDWQERELMSGVPNKTLIFSSTRFGFAPLPRTGHVTTLTFTATEDLVNPSPMQIDLSITTVSSPPRRVNQMVETRHLIWG